MKNMGVSHRHLYDALFFFYRCKETMKNVIENAIDTVRNKIVDLLMVMVRKVRYFSIVKDFTSFSI